jgi:pimeloyl-ACP methyl ester carboxylesterase
VAYHTMYRTQQIDGLSIFYREAGPKDAPTLLLLHGLPSSSRMFEPLFSRLSERYHLVAPDYPGFGHSDWPDPKTFLYTFDHYAEITNHFTESLGLSRYTLYMQDYGGPVGFRMALAYDDRPGRNYDEADGKEGQRRDRHTANSATHRRVRGRLNGNERADDHGGRTQQDRA